MDFPDGSAVKKSACNEEAEGDAGSIPRLNPGFLPGEYHRQRSLTS